MNIRNGKIHDASKLAKISILAAGGTFELLLKNLKKGVSVHQVMTALCRSENTEYSYKYFIVAERNGKIVGGANIVSVADRYKLASNINPILQNKFDFGIVQLIKFFFRAKHLRGMNSLKAPTNSLHLNDISIFPEHQGKGIGKRLMHHIIEKARTENFNYISLYVWTDNEQAIKFYKNLGFKIERTAKVKRHEYLPHDGSHLMLLSLSSQT